MRGPGLLRRARRSARRCRSPAKRTFELDPLNVSISAVVRLVRGGGCRRSPPRTPGRRACTASGPEPPADPVQRPLGVAPAEAGRSPKASWVTARRRRDQAVGAHPDQAQPGPGVQAGRPPYSAQAVA